MGKSSQGVFGGWTNKVGNVVGRMRGGVNIYSIYQPNVSNPKTTAQEQGRRKFKMCSQFLSAMAGIAKIGFKAYSQGGYWMGVGVAHNYDDVATGSWPSYTYNFSKLVVSKGMLANGYGTSCSAQGSDLNLSWTDNSGIGNALDTDLLAIGVYNEDKNVAELDSASAPRSARQASFSTPSSWTGDKVHVYAFMHRADDSLSAETLYLGQFTL